MDQQSCFMDRFNLPAFWWSILAIQVSGDVWLFPVIPAINREPQLPTRSNFSLNFLLKVYNFLVSCLQALTEMFIVDQL